MARQKMVDGKLIDLTPEEEAARDAEEAAALAEAEARKEPERIASLWNQANALAEAAFDHNSRAKALSWKVDGSPQWRLDRIAAIDAWMDMVWGAYFQAKADPAVTELPALPPCPHSFSDLLQE